MQKTDNTRRLVLVLAITLGVIAPPIVQGQRATGLSPEAQAAVNRGLAAGEHSDWARALAEFTQAQKAAPTNPLVLFNLGVTHSNLGHEIAAVVWLHAYAAADPKSPNMTKIRLE